MVPSDLKDITFYPEKPITSYNDRDGAWVEVVEAIQAAATYARQNQLPPLPPASSAGVVLAHGTIQSLHAAAINVGFSRNALLEGIDLGVVASLPHAGSPSAQILTDLHTLNRLTQLRDGSDPMMVWLANAEHLSGPRMEASTFRDARKARRG